MPKYWQINWPKEHPDQKAINEAIVSSLITGETVYAVSKSDGKVIGFSMVDPRAMVVSRPDR